MEVRQGDEDSHAPSKSLVVVSHFDAGVSLMYLSSELWFQSADMDGAAREQ